MHHVKFVKYNYGVPRYAKGGEALIWQGCKFTLNHKMANDLMLRDTGDVERETAQLELQQKEMKSCNKQVILKMVYKLKWKE